MDKRGVFLSSYLLKMLAIVAFILIVTIFYLLFYFQKPEDFTISSKALNLDSKIMINNLLDTPVEVDGRYIRVIQLIEMEQVDDSYEIALRKEVGSLLAFAEHLNENAYDDKEYKSCRTAYMLRIYDADAYTNPFLASESEQVKNPIIGSLDIMSPTYSEISGGGISNTRGGWHCYSGAQENSLNKVMMNLTLSSGKRITVQLNTAYVKEE